MSIGTIKSPRVEEDTYVQIYSTVTGRTYGRPFGPYTMERAHLVAHELDKIISMPELDTRLLGAGTVAHLRLYGRR